MFGFLNVYKPLGLTSHDVINKLRRVLHLKRIGHAGTLDPLAEGVLPIAISNATRLIDLLPEDKEYLAEFKLGYISKSYDMETELEFFSDRKVTIAEIKNILKNFTGTIKQKPPIYSAIKVGGRKLYEIAREGESLEVPERTIQVDKIEIKSFDFETQTGEILIACSKGTYIRSIINDIGQKLKSGGVMTKLTRSKSGGMKVENSINLNDITSKDVVEKNLINPIQMLNFPEYKLNDEEFAKVKNGNSINNSNYNKEIFLTYNEQIVALGFCKKGLIKIKKVFLPWKKYSTEFLV